MNQNLLFDGLTREQWLGMLTPIDGAMHRHALALFALTGIPRSYLDVGCGTGVMAKAAYDLGADALGLDQLALDEAWLCRVDLRERFDLGRQFQVVSCIEVAEHIPAEHEAAFLDSLVAHIAPGGLLAFTSPWPAAENMSASHVNLKYPFAWRRELDARGLSFSFGLTLQLGFLWSNIWSPLMWLAPTLQVFTKGTPSLPSGVTG